MSNMHVYSNLIVITALILLLTSFTFEVIQQHTYTYFSNSIDNNSNPILINYTEDNVENATTYQDNKKAIFAVADTPERYKPISNSTESDRKPTHIMETKQEKNYTSEGCSLGFGYEIDDENPICEPLGQTKEEKDNQTKFAIFCEALGCPFNPPSPYVD